MTLKAILATPIQSFDTPAEWKCNRNPNAFPQAKNDQSILLYTTATDRDLVNVNLYAYPEGSPDIQSSFITLKPADQLSVALSLLRHNHIDLPKILDEHETTTEQLIQERDQAAEAADRLAYALYGDTLGEHTSDNNPWENALERLNQPQPTTAPTITLKHWNENEEEDPEQSATLGVIHAGHVPRAGELVVFQQRTYFVKSVTLDCDAGTILVFLNGSD